MVRAGEKTAVFLKKISKNCHKRTVRVNFFARPSRTPGLCSMAKLLSASPVANLQKNAPKWSEFGGAWHGSCSLS
jgi:hypothetical protein